MSHHAWLEYLCILKEVVRALALESLSTLNCQSIPGWDRSLQKLRGWSPGLDNFGALHAILKTTANSIASEITLPVPQCAFSLDPGLFPSVRSSVV
jgi:hypothetical protein